jgi:hypothetical protein
MWSDKRRKRTPWMLLPQYSFCDCACSPSSHSLAALCRIRRDHRRPPAADAPRQSGGSKLCRARGRNCFSGHPGRVQHGIVKRRHPTRCPVMPARRASAIEMPLYERRAAPAAPAPRPKSERVTFEPSRENYPTAKILQIYFAVAATDSDAAQPPKARQRARTTSFSGRFSRRNDTPQQNVRRTRSTSRSTDTQPACNTRPIVTKNQHDEGIPLLRRRRLLHQDYATTPLPSSPTSSTSTRAPKALRT